MSAILAEPVDHFLTAPDAPSGETLYLRRREGRSDALPPVLMLHGSTIPGSLAFDLRLGDRSWMEDLARSRRDVWSLDLRGYGRSWKPPVRPRADGGEEPAVDTEDAIADLVAAASYVREKTGASWIDLIGWSWGATVVAATASRRLTPVRRIVLHAPQWVRDTPSAMVTAQALQQSYRRVDAEALERRWFLGLSEAVRMAVSERGWRQTFHDAIQAQGADFRVPNGTIKDIAAYWNAGRPFYRPERVDVPVRIITGSADVDTPIAQSLAILDLLPAATSDLVIVPGATHFALLEPGRDTLFTAAHEFLNRG
jgi:pimeloyl-ACP methyl ester carboxylesterase